MYFHVATFFHQLCLQLPRFEANSWPSRDNNGPRYVCFRFQAEGTVYTNAIAVRPWSATATRAARLTLTVVCSDVLVLKRAPGSRTCPHVCPVSTLQAHLAEACRQRQLLHDRAAPRWHRHVLVLQHVQVQQRPLRAGHAACTTPRVQQHHRTHVPTRAVRTPRPAHAAPAVCNGKEVMHA